jgi:hypothetical protein
VTTPENAVKLLQDRAWAAIPIACRRWVEREFRDLTAGKLGWRSDLCEGTLREIARVLHHSLERDAGMPLFEGVNVEVYIGRCCAQLNSHFGQTPGAVCGTFTGYRIWRTTDSFFLCGSSELMRGKALPAQGPPTVECASCGQKMVLPELKDIAAGGWHSPQGYPYRCRTCDGVFCFNCLKQSRGIDFGGGRHSVDLACPRCLTLSISYAHTGPEPEDPEDLVRRRARELLALHGKLVEVRCLAKDRIEFVYGDGKVVDQRLGGAKTLVTCGYTGQGPRQFRAFLVQSGVETSGDEVRGISPPCVLKCEHT